ncbi:VOC family protein [Comamonas badia]|uniref:VOC family protein n=1 Tax=Comamonas badia TaxID=265291 RepID=UPI00040C7B83|nr:VOC family protein [Comamonas badia]
MTVCVHELGYLGFEVSDMPRWERFAREVLGVGVSRGPQDTLRLRLDAAPARFILRQGGANDFAFAGWKLASAAEADAFARQLDSLGLKGTWGTDDELAVRHAQRMLHFTDPEGNRHEVYVAAPTQEAPFRSHLVSSGFITGAGGAGHVVFEAEHYPDTIAFANQALGARLSDHINLVPVPGVDIEVSFFHANERHHSLAVAPRSPAPGPRKRIHHFMIEVASMADVGRARDRCLNFGLPVVMDIGQHPNDQMVSFYAHTPSGFLVEVGWGGVKVDDASWQVADYDHVSAWGHRPYGVRPEEASAMPAPVVEVA